MLLTSESRANRFKSAALSQIQNIFFFHFFCCGFRLCPANAIIFVKIYIFFWFCSQMFSVMCLLWHFGFHLTFLYYFCWHFLLVIGFNKPHQKFQFLNFFVIFKQKLFYSIWSCCFRQTMHNGVK